MAAVTQVRHDTAGRLYYLRKQAEQNSKKEAMRALKRRISDAAYHRLLADAWGTASRTRLLAHDELAESGPGRTTQGRL